MLGIGWVSNTCFIQILELNTMCQIGWHPCIDSSTRIFLMGIPPSSCIPFCIEVYINRDWRSLSKYLWLFRL